MKIGYFYPQTQKNGILAAPILKLLTFKKPNGGKHWELKNELLACFV
jgi:hypothetical protein